MKAVGVGETPQVSTILSSSSCGPRGSPALREGTCAIVKLNGHFPGKGVGKGPGPFGWVSKSFWLYYGPSSPLPLLILKSPPSP